VAAGATPAASVKTGAGTPWEMATVVFKPGAQAPPSPPAAPGAVTATAASQSAAVSWSAPASGGSPITSYTVTPYVGATAQPATTVTGSPPATTATIGGLANGTTYTFTVAATNAIGTGPASAPSSPVTPAAPVPPGAPGGVTATAGNQSATVRWTAPASGGSPITLYTVTPYLAGTAQPATAISGSPPATTATITGLTNGAAYTFTVTATSAAGTGPPSAASAPVTPAAAVAPAFVQQVSAHGSANYSVAYYSEIIKQGLVGANPMLFAEGVPNASSAHLSLMLGVKGACQTIIGTRTAGLDALRLAALRIAEEDLKSDFPHLKVRPLLGDYSQGLNQLASTSGRKLVLYIGSSIGNFELSEAGNLLRSVGKGLRRGDALLLGVDLVKDAGLLRAAYNDSQGVTARFNLNILSRINRELDADFDLKAFRHVAEWNPRASRMEIYVESTRPQTVWIAGIGMEIQLRRGERIHTENSYKFTDAMVEKVLSAGGFALERCWKDPKGWFGVYLARI